jgi:DNA-directed RNA polymerase subunit M/transcription elongation factor TFIIS
MPLEPAVGSWYIVVTCANCKSTLYLFRDLTNGTGSLSATYFVTCPECHHKGEYEARHYRHSHQVNQSGNLLSEFPQSKIP